MAIKARARNRPLACVLQKSLTPSSLIAILSSVSVLLSLLSSAHTRMYTESQDFLLPSNGVISVYEYS